MGHRLMLVAVIALFSVSAQAQKNPPGRSPCDGGEGPNPMFTASTGNPVVLTFQHAFSFYTLTTPVVTINGNSISVVQLMLIPPALQFPVPGPPTSTCNRQSISLGELPPGSYVVTWSYQDPSSSQPIMSFGFLLTVPSVVPAMSPQALLALVALCALIGVGMLRR
jgi:hypothetical protein